MNNSLKLSLSCALVAGVAGLAQGQVQVDWYRTVAPNIFGAASYGDFWDNVKTSVTTMDGVDFGTGNSAFTNVTETTGMDAYVTSFESRNGAFESGEYGVRSSWVYYISNADGSNMDNTMLASATKNYSYSWEGVHESFWGDIAFGDLSANGRVGVRSDGTFGTDINDAYVGFLVISGNSWLPTNWTGTLGVDHTWTTEILASDPDRFTKLAQLAAYTGVSQDYWGFSINFGGQEFNAPNINVVPAPASAALLGLGGLLAARRRRG